jgi:hypothetical protein
MYKLIWLSMLFLTIPELGKGQEGTVRLGLESQYGWILAHNSELKEIAQSHPISIGFSSQWMKTTRKNW